MSKSPAENADAVVPITIARVSVPAIVNIGLPCNRRTAY